MPTKSSVISKSVNDLLFDRAVRHGVYLERYKRGEVSAMLRLLNEGVIPDVRSKLELAASATTRKRAARLLAEARGTVAGGLRSASKALRTRLSDLAVSEAAWQRAVFSNVVPLDVSFAMPPAPTLHALVTSRPIQGHLISDWFDALSKSTQRQVTGAFNIGVAAGESVPNIVRRLTPIVDTMKRHVTTHVRTAVNHVSNAARLETIQANDDVIKGVQLVATLDARTTEICMSLDGQVRPPNDAGDITPPLHMQCRSTLVPVVKSLKELGLSGKKWPATTRASMNGQVPARETYQSWLKKQPKSFQNMALGRGRAELFRSGVPLTKFVDPRGKALTLEELQAVDAPDAAMAMPQGTTMHSLLAQLEDAASAGHGLELAPTEEVISLAQQITWKPNAKGFYSCGVKGAKTLAERAKKVLSGTFKQKGAKPPAIKPAAPAPAAPMPSDLKGVQTMLETALGESKGVSIAAPTPELIEVAAQIGWKVNKSGGLSMGPKGVSVFLKRANAKLGKSNPVKWNRGEAMRTHQEWLRSITGVERRAAHDYTRSTSTCRFMRHVQQGRAAGDRAVRQNIEALEAMLRRAPYRTTVAHRGIRDYKFLFKEGVPQRGGTITFDSFQSFSSKEVTARAFGARSNFKALHLKITGRHQGADLHGISPHTGEREILFNRGARFRIVDVQNLGQEGWFVELRALDDVVTAKPPKPIPKVRDLTSTWDVRKRLKALYPNAHMEFGAMELDSMKAVGSVLEEFAEKNAQVAAQLKSVTLKKLKRSTFAQIHNQWHLELNDYWWTTSRDLRMLASTKNLASKANWSMGATPESVVWHELGHLLHYADDGKWAYKAKKLIESTKVTAQSLTKYAQKNWKETFAEAWTDMITNPKEQWKPFTKLFAPELEKSFEYMGGSVTW